MKYESHLAKIDTLKVEIDKSRPLSPEILKQLELVNIHPFVDGNGRVARLLMNPVLLQEGYPIAIIPPVVRADYISALVQANKGNKKSFFNFITCMAYETMKDYLRIIRQM